MSRTALRRSNDAEIDESKPCHLSASRWRQSSDDARAIVCCDGVIDLIATLFGIPSRELRSRTRAGRTAAQARQLGMYVAHVVLGLTMREVGLGFGRDRTSVVHACHLIEDMRDDIEFDRIVVMTERVVAAAFAAGQPE